MDVIPILRERLRDIEEHGDPEADAHAAVAAVLRSAGDRTDVLLIRRQDRENDPWSGHMGFPGGRRDADDADLLATVVRETREEVGLDLAAHAELLGRLPHLPAISRGRATGMVITPFVFRLDRELELTLCDLEVREVVWASLADLLSGSRNSTFRYLHEEKHFDLPAFDVEGRIVWGLTYRMLETLLAVIRDGRSPLP